MRDVRLWEGRSGCVMNLKRKTSNVYLTEISWSEEFLFDGFGVVKFNLFNVLFLSKKNLESKLDLICH